MKEQVCRFQRTFFDLTNNVHVSTCGNYKCFYHCDVVSRKICDSCGLKTPLNDEDKSIRDTLKTDVFNLEEMPQRDVQERVQLLDTYCLKCKHLNKENLTCTSCDCVAKLPVDELVRYQHLHCPLELW